MPDHKGWFLISIISFHSIIFTIIPTLTTNSPNLNFNFTSTLTFNSNINTFAMAATKITTFAPSFPIPYGRSGYNKYDPHP